MLEGLTKQTEIAAFVSQLFFSFSNLWCNVRHDAQAKVFKLIVIEKNFAFGARQVPVLHFQTCQAPAT